MKVEQLMTRTVKTCGPHDPLNVAARIMWEHDCGCVPVVVPDEGGQRVVGMLTDRDVCMAAYTQGRPLAEIPAASAMSEEVCSCTPADSIKSALKVLETKQLRRLPIVDAHEHLVGLLSLADVAREVAYERKHKTKAIGAADISTTVGAISRPRQAARDLVTAA